MSELPEHRSTKKRFRVHMRSIPGPYEQYDGKLVVYSDGEDLFMDAVRELRRTSFPDRSSDMWKMTSAEMIEDFFDE